MRTSVRIAVVAAIVLLLAATATAHIRVDLMDGYKPQLRRPNSGSGGVFDFMKIW